MFTLSTADEQVIRDPSPDRINAVIEGLPAGGAALAHPRIAADRHRAGRDGLDTAPEPDGGRQKLRLQLTPSDGRMMNQVSGSRCSTTCPPGPGARK